MRRSIDDHLDDHPADDEDRPPANWAVGISDDCEACDDVRVVLTRDAPASLRRAGERRTDDRRRAGRHRRGRPSYGGGALERREGYYLRAGGTFEV
jgi:hypothetical protein